MKKIQKSLARFSLLAFFLMSSPIVLAADDTTLPTVQIGFEPPGLSDILSFGIKFLFVIAAIMALLYLFLGALAWITSGGDKDAVHKAQIKIQAAVLGLVIIIAIVAVAVTLEQFVFQQKICFGFTCGVKIPSLIK